MKTLRDVKTGSTVKVVKLHGEGAIKRRIIDMRITKGTEIFVRKVAPLGDPVEVTVRPEISKPIPSGEILKTVMEPDASRSGSREEK